MWKISRYSRGRRGQSILEYLVIATVIVSAILFIRPFVNTHIRNLYNNSANKVAQASNSLGNLSVEVPQ